MVEHMKAVAEKPIELSVEERNLLSVAYKVELQFFSSNKQRCLTSSIVCTERDRLKACVMEGAVFHRAKDGPRENGTCQGLQSKNVFYPL